MIDEVCSLFSNLSLIFFFDIYTLVSGDPSLKREFSFNDNSFFGYKIAQVYAQLIEKTKSIPGAKVENNKFCVSVHYRCVEEKVYIYICIYIKTN